MSSSESDYKLPDDSRESSTDGGPRSTSQRPSQPPSSPRKRCRQTRSGSASSAPDTKRHLQGHYNDGYRTLFNESVYSAAARFVPDNSLKPPHAQIGVSQWSPEEKSIFFAALERLGKDNLPGIASAVGTKSIPEVHELSLLLHAAAAVKQRDTKVTLRDIPAATRVSRRCSEQLELAGDALAWYQEQFEAKQEQERHGKYWLITPEVAKEIEDAVETSRAPSFASSPPLTSGDDQGVQAAKDKPTTPQILREIPEANLLDPSALLKLSSSVFMNGSPTPPSPYPHWSTLVSPLASEPSIYRTALTDLNTLVVSLTKRVTQACIVQATSRLRSQGWRTTKGAKPVVKKRDVFATLDMLDLPRDGRERWRGVARRCGLRVFDGEGKSKREVDWIEVEGILGAYQKPPVPRTSDEETPALTSGAEDEDFKLRAGRSGTPLPPERLVHSDSDYSDDSDREHEEDGMSMDGSQSVESSASSTGSVKPSLSKTGVELNTLEEFDREASRQEELRLWNLLGKFPPSAKADFAKLTDEVDEQSKESSKRFTGDNDWRDWTEYHADWEEFHVPVPGATFRANQRNPQSVPTPSSELYDIDSGLEAGQPSGEESRGRRRKKRRTTEVEIPIRGARAYAALQDKTSVLEDRDARHSDSDDAEVPAPSIEDANYGISALGSSSADEMDWDAKPTMLP